MCEHIKSDGTPCRARPLPGGRFCFSHDPAIAGRRREGQRRGGRERSRRAATLPPDTPDLPLATVQDVRAALAEVFNAVRVGRIDPKVGNCLALVAGQLVRAIEGGELEKRVAALEARQARPRRAV